MFQTFEALICAAAAEKQKRVLAVAGAEDAPVIDAALMAKARGIAEPILVGNVERIRELLIQAGEKPDVLECVNAPAGEAGRVAVELIRAGRANALMKGMLETRDLLRHVVRKESGLTLGGLMSHVALFELPGYPKLLALTDGGMMLYPDLSEKVQIVRNAVYALRCLGEERPKVAVVCGIESENPKMKETVDAAELVRMNARGELADCDVVGPISYDVAMVPEIARHKGFDCPHVGQFDILLLPDLAAGNILGKCFLVNCRAKMAGIIVGAKAPIVINSRGSTAEEKLYAIAAAVMAAPAFS